MHYYIYPKGSNAEYIALAIQSLGAAGFDCESIFSKSGEVDSIESSLIESSHATERERESKPRGAEFSAIDSIESANKNSHEKYLQEYNKQYSKFIHQKEIIQNTQKQKLKEILPKSKFSHTISFLDDSCEESSIAQNAEKIRQEISQNRARLLLATYKFSDSCLKTLKSHKITKAYDGIAKIGGALNDFYAEKYKGKKVIAIALNGYELAQKHLGDLRERLKNAGFYIIYVVWAESMWQAELVADLQEKGEDFIFANFEFFEQLCFFPMVINQAEYFTTNQKVRSLFIHDSFDMAPQAVYTLRENVAGLMFGYLQADYLNVHSRAHADFLAKKLSFSVFTIPQIEARFVCGGYPSIEKQVADFGEVDYSIKRDSVIFISNSITFFDTERSKKLMNIVLNLGYRVLFKAHTAFKRSFEFERDFAAQFADNPNFIFYTEPRLSRDEMQRALCFVEANSSMCYSAPVISKRPCIMPYPSKARLAASQMPDFLEKDDGFFHPSLHIRIFEDDEESTLIAHLRELEKTKTQKEWEAKIKDYCQNDLYNFGKSAEYIAQWICEWYENREILAI